MIRQISIVIVFFFLTNASSFSQDNFRNKRIDSLLRILPLISVDTLKVNCLNQIADEYKSLNPYQGIDYGKQALSLSRKIKWGDGIAASLSNIGLNNSIIGETAIAEKNYLEALLFAKSNFNLSKINRGIGNLNFQKSNYPDALKYYLEAIKFSQKITNNTESGKNFSAIGNAFRGIKDYKKALLYFNKSLQINKNQNNKTKIANDLCLIGEVYFFFK